MWRWETLRIRYWQNQSLDWKKCCSIILKMVQFRALKFNIVINPDIGLILIWYWWWYWSDIDLEIDLILIWYWSGIDLILIWYWSDIDLYWSWYCMIFHLVLANTGETKVKPWWNCFPVNLWLSFKPSNHIIHSELQGHDVLGNEWLAQSDSPGAMWAAVAQGGNVSHERLLLVCPAGSWVLEVQHQSDVCQEMALRGQGESDPIIKMVV